MITILLSLWTSLAANASASVLPIAPAPAAFVYICGDDPAPIASKPAAAAEKAPDAKQQLKKADELRRAIHGKAEARRDLTLKAVAAYNAVNDYFPDAKQEGSMGLFRVGELKRTLGLTDEARDAFAKVVAQSPERKLAARALFETAHLYRRAKELGKAMDTYRKVAADFADETATRDDSLYWIGMMHVQNKEYAKARESFKAVADRGVDPLDRIRAFDKIASTYIKENNRDLASKAIEESKSALHESASEPSSRGARVRKALERMSSIRALERLDEKDAPKDNTKKKSMADADEEDGDDEAED
ncbi:MAG: tetratricopeptide repeat protein [Planctomycetes bacterium]|nr:tetratricopeptide repeat protein [Planctomycetota bacterium]